VSSPASDGPLRRLLSFFGLVNSSDDRFAPPAAPARPHREMAPAETTAEERSTTGDTLGSAARTVAVYFGLAEPDADSTQPGRSRYGNVSPALDAEMNALRARVEALEAKLSEGAGRDADGAGASVDRR
jgi:hypothetical protein